MVDQKSMLKPLVHVAALRSTNAVKTADWIAPTKLIHVVSDSCAGYLFNVNACNIRVPLSFQGFQYIFFIIFLVQPAGLAVNQHVFCFRLVWCGSLTTARKEK